MAFLALSARRPFPRDLWLSSSCITIHGITSTGLPTPREEGGMREGREGGRGRREGGRREGEEREGGGR